MITGIKFETKEIAFTDINLLPWLPNVAALTYSCETSHPSNIGVLTRDSAQLLLKLYPLVLWGNKNYCVLGRRVLHLVAPYLLSRDIIRVWCLPSATEDEVKLLMTVEPLLNQIAFATQAGSKGLFETSRHTDKSVIQAVSPVLGQSIESISKLFSDVSPSTLFKLNAKNDD